MFAGDLFHHLSVVFHVCSIVRIIWLNSGCLCHIHDNRLFASLPYPSPFNPPADLSAGGKFFPRTQAIGPVGRMISLRPTIRGTKQRGGLSPPIGHIRAIVTRRRCTIVSGQSLAVWFSKPLRRVSQPQGGREKMRVAVSFPRRQRTGRGGFGGVNHVTHHRCCHIPPCRRRGCHPSRHPSSASDHRTSVPAIAAVR